MRFITGFFSFSDRDYTGTRITTDKAVAVFSGHECGSVGVGSTTCDHLVVGVPPVSSLGTLFIVPPIIGKLAISDNRALAMLGLLI